MGMINNDLKMSGPALGGGDKKKKLPEWTKQKSGEVANVFNSLDKPKTQEQINQKEKQFRPKGENNVFGKYERLVRTVQKKKSPTYKVSQSAKDFVNPEKLKVNKNYQKRVNTILGD